MILQLKYFGLIASALQKEEEQLSFDRGDRLEDLHSYLLQLYPVLSTLSFQYAINQRLSSKEESITDHAEIALLPPFAGG